MLYFIGYNLSGKDAEVVDQLRREIAQKFGVEAALKLPPHLTLYYPFEMDESGLRVLADGLADFAGKQSSFDLRVPGFNYFDESVWFIDVEQSEKLFNVKKGLVELMRMDFQMNENTHGRTDVHFHITLAYKDVTPEKFKLIGDYLAVKKAPIERLVVDGITLFQKGGENWEALKMFEFSSK